MLGLLVVAALVRPRIRVALVVAPAVMLAAAAGYIALRQARHHLPPIFEWPTFFFRARTLAWIAIVVLAADAVMEIVSSRGRAAASVEDGADPPGRVSPEDREPESPRGDSGR